MGVVVAARDVALDRSVAIKFLHRLSPRDVEFSARFRREARAMAKLTNEHCVRVLDVGELPTGDPYLVMEHLEGADLSELVEERGPLPVAEVVDYVLQACEAVAEAHALGIVHRDLKPSNLFLAHRADGTSVIKVLDFGIAKVPSGDPEGPQSLTSTTAFLGSPAYISPEQLLCARDVGVGADIWSLGAILHKLLAGRPPFTADTMPQVCSLIISSAPPRVRDARPEVPREMQEVILRCLAKEPGDRFRDVAELARALVRFAAGGAHPSADRASKILGAQTVTLDEGRPSRRVRAGILVAGGAVLTAALLFVGARRSGSASAYVPASASESPSAPGSASSPSPASSSASASASSLALAPASASTPASASPAPGPPRAPATPRRAPAARPAKGDNAEFGGRK
jgi:serine/threonine-protein kinase